MSSERRDRWAVTCVLALALGLRIALARTAVNAIWPDEIFQTLEQAHRAAFGFGVVPWEFRDACRSWLLPGLLAGVVRVGGALGLTPPTAVAILLSFVSILPIWLLYEHTRVRWGTTAACLAAITFSCWFELLYFAPKALSEAVAGHLLLAALLLDPARRLQLFAALLGTICALRVQLAPVAFCLALIGAWPLTQRWKEAALWFAAPLLCAGAIDALTWSYPFESFVNNFRVNVLEGKSARYGVAPPWSYLTAELRVLSWAAVPLYALATVGGRRLPHAAFAALLTFAIHAGLGHKEYRFVYPGLAAVALLAALGVAQVAAGSRALGMLASGLLIGASAVRGAAFHNDQTTLGLALYPPASQWENGRGPLQAFALFGSRPETCGVGLLGVPWFLTGGYAWLGRNVPIVEYGSLEDLIARAEQVNAVVAVAGLPPRIGAFERRACWTAGCAYIRSGGCAEIPGYDINRVLEARGE